MSTTFRNTLLLAGAAGGAALGFRTVEGHRVEAARQKREMVTRVIEEETRRWEQEKQELRGGGGRKAGGGGN